MAFLSLIFHFYLSFYSYGVCVSVFHYLCMCARKSWVLSLRFHWNPICTRHGLSAITTTRSLCVRITVRCLFYFHFFFVDSTSCYCCCWCAVVWCVAVFILSNDLIRFDFIFKLINIECVWKKKNNSAEKFQPLLAIRSAYIGRIETCSGCVSCFCARSTCGIKQQISCVCPFFFQYISPSLSLFS